MHYGLDSVIVLFAKWKYFNKGFSYFFFIYNIIFSFLINNILKAVKINRINKSNKHL